MPTWQIAQLDEKAWFFDGVQVANDVVIWVKGINDIEILTMGKIGWKHGIIHDVLYVLNLMRNLFSLAKNGDKRMATYNKNKM